MLAGTLHGVHAITAQLSPVGGDGKGDGCDIIESDGVRLIVFLTPTGASADGSPAVADDNLGVDLLPLAFGSLARSPGTKFVLLVSPSYPSLTPPPAIPSLAPPPAPASVAVREGKALLGQVYVAYADFVMKNPFQPLEMPIRSDGFDQKVESIVRIAMLP